MTTSLEVICAKADRRHQRTGSLGRKIVIENPEDEKPIHLAAVLTMVSSYLYHKARIKLPAGNM